MNLNEYNKIRLCRCSQNKKNIVQILSAFFDISHIIIDDSNKTICVPARLIVRLSTQELNILCRLEHTFGICSQVVNDCLTYKYSYL